MADATSFSDNGEALGSANMWHLNSRICTLQEHIVSHLMNIRRAAMYEKIYIYIYEAWNQSHRTEDAQRRGREGNDKTTHR